MWYTTRVAVIYLILAESHSSFISLFGNNCLRILLLVCIYWLIDWSIESFYILESAFFHKEIFDYFLVDFWYQLLKKSGRFFLVISFSTLQGVLNVFLMLLQHLVCRLLMFSCNYCNIFLWIIFRLQCICLMFYIVNGIHTFSNYYFTDLY